MNGVLIYNIASSSGQIQEQRQHWLHDSFQMYPVSLLEHTGNQQEIKHINIWLYYYTHSQYRNGLETQ